MWTTNSTMKVLVLLLLTVHLTSGIHILEPYCDRPGGTQCSSSELYADHLRTKCYDELGCFPNIEPWVSAERPYPPPLHPSEVNVQIYCYTRASPERFIITLWPKIDLGGCPLTAEDYSKAVFITHGFLENTKLPWLSEMKTNYLKATKAIVFLVDWGKGAGISRYSQAASNTRIAGAEVARFFNFLDEEYRMDFGRVHLIGYCMGAHVMAYAAKAVGGQINHLTALDPAQNGFEISAKEVRVHHTDAKFVEVVHTNGAPFTTHFGFGMVSPIGHVDFYVNGGVHQPGCSFPEQLPEMENMEDIDTIPLLVLYELVFSCSHTRAYEYYMHAFYEGCTILGRKAKLIRDPSDIHAFFGLIDTLWLGERCNIERCVAMGLNSNLFHARGPLYAVTSTDPPYCDLNAPYGTFRIYNEKLETSVECPLCKFGRYVNEVGEKIDNYKMVKVPR